MTIYNTNLNINYCKSWGFWEAIREIIQNAIDQQTINKDNTFEINYDEKKKVIIISNKESILERSTILLGSTSKENQEETIGQHGEGYKIALLILSRLGKRVVINNYKKNEKWTPLFKEDKKYDGEEVLKINVKKYRFTRLPDSNLTWNISNVSKKDWDSLKDKYLKFNNNLKKIVLGKEHGKGVEILLDKKMSGSIYINGLFVEKLNEKSNYKYGYNLPSSMIQLDRDRRSVASFDFKWQTSSIWQGLAERSDKYAELLRELIVGGHPEVEYFRPIGAEKSKVVTNFSETFIKDNGKNAYPVSSQKEFEHVKKLSSRIKPVFVSKKEKEIIEENKDFNLDKIITKGQGGNVKLTPYKLLDLYLFKYRNNLHHEALNDLELLVEASKNWDSKFKMEDNKKSRVSTEIQGEFDFTKEVVKAENDFTLDFDPNIPFLEHK
jgi:hypothetical protein